MKSSMDEESKEAPKLDLFAELLNDVLVQKPLDD